MFGFVKKMLGLNNKGLRKAENPADQRYARRSALKIAVDAGTHPEALYYLAKDTDPNCAPSRRGQ